MSEFFLNTLKRTQEVNLCKLSLHTYKYSKSAFKKVTHAFHIADMRLPWFPVLIAVKLLYFADPYNTCKTCNCTMTTGNMWAVDCSQKSNCNVTRIPTFADDTMYLKIWLLNMSSCNDLVPEKDSFLNFTNLKVLDLYNTTLKQNNISFSGLKKLEYLNISQNEQYPLTNNTNATVFAELVSLKELRAFGTTGTYVHDGYPEPILKQLPTLKELWIDARNMKFGEAFESLTELETLRISGDMVKPPWRSREFCEMADVTTDTFKHLIHVKRLLIRKCSLSKVSNGSFSTLGKLEYLDLSLNEMLTLTTAFKAMENLSLTVKDIVLESVEDGPHMDCGVKVDALLTVPLKNLAFKNLSLENNAIIRFTTGSFSNLPDTLEHLNLRKNDFGMGLYLFSAFNMRNLKSLDLSYNFFSNSVMMWNDFEKMNLEKELFSYYSQDTNCQENVFSNIVDTYHQDNATSFSLKNGYSTAAPTSSKNGHAYAYETTKYEYSKNEYTADLVCPGPRLSLPPGTITAYLPPKLETIDLSFSKLAFSIREFFFDKNNVLRTIKAFGSLLHCWEGPIHGVNNIEYIDLRSNDCSRVSRRFFTGFPKLMFLDISWNLLETVVSRTDDGDLFRNNTELTHLHMSFNHIRYIPYRFLKHQKNLLHLDLSNNALHTFNLKIDHMVNLTLVNLMGNRIPSLDIHMQEQLLQLVRKRAQRQLSIDLRDNLLECSCASLGFFRWIYSHMASDQGLNIIIDECYEDSKTSGKLPISNPKDMEMIIQRLEKKCASYTTLIVIFSVMFFVLMITVIVAMIHRNWWKILYWYYVSNPQKRTETRGGYVVIGCLDIDFKFDVYIASVNEDMDFVTEQIKPRLASKYRIFLQDADILPGQNMYCAIGNAIHISKMVIFVISHHGKNDPHLKIAIHFAQEETVKREQPVYLGLFRDVRPAEWSHGVQQIRRERYIDYPTEDDSVAIERFWQTCESIVNDVYEMTGIADSL